MFSQIVHFWSPVELAGPAMVSYYVKSLSFITVQSTPSQTLIQIFLAPPAPSNTTNLIRVEVCWREKDSILKSAPTVFKLKFRIFISRIKVLKIILLFVNPEY